MALAYLTINLDAFTTTTATTQRASSMRASCHG